MKKRVFLWIIISLSLISILLIAGCETVGDAFRFRFLQKSLISYGFSKNIENQINKYDKTLSSDLASKISGDPLLTTQVKKLFDNYQLIKGGGEPVARNQKLPNAATFSSNLDEDCFKTEFDFFYDVFNEAVEGSWIYNGPGRGPWIPGMMNDEVAMAPYILYNLGEECNDYNYIKKADITVEYELYLIESVLRGETRYAYESMMGGPALIHAIGNYNGDRQTRLKINNYAELAVLGGSLLMIGFHEELVEQQAGFVSPLILLAAAADMDFDLYEKTGNKVYARLGLAILETAHDKYWVTTEYGSYYSTQEMDEPWDFEMGNILSPLIKAYSYTKDDKYKYRIDSTFAVMGEYLRDNDDGGYWNRISKTGKGLSNNLFSLKAHILMYEETHDEFHLERAEEIINFIENVLYDGNGHIMHDIIEGEVSWDYCKGCQFFFLNEAYNFEKVKK